MADGFHRVQAKEATGAKEIKADVHLGENRDAVLYAVGANASHGLRRTNADKRRAVERLLRDHEWKLWSDNAIAKQCGVGHPLVGRIRKEIQSTTKDDPPTLRRGMDNRLIDTSKIGKSAQVSKGTNKRQRKRNRLVKPPPHLLFNLKRL